MRATLLPALFAAAAAGLGEVVNSSTFQLFGDYVARVKTRGPNPKEHTWTFEMSAD